MIPGIGERCIYQADAGNAKGKYKKFGIWLSIEYFASVALIS